MSLVEWLRTKYPKCEVTRPENIYEEPREPHFVTKWDEWECYAITRDPIKRIISGRQYFTELRTIPIKNMIHGKYKQARNYQNVGFANAIRQSHYSFYINRFERNHGVKITTVRFEDLVKDEDFPHINESNVKIPWSEEDLSYLNEELDKEGITY